MTKPTTAEFIEWLDKLKTQYMRRYIWSVEDAANEVALCAQLQAAQEDAKEFDANVNRLKACEHIADGDEGWEKLINECPSTAAVARLRNAAQEMAKAIKRIGDNFAEFGTLTDGEFLDELWKSETKFREAGGE